MNEVSSTLDRFTERARKVLDHSQDEARRFNHNYIGTEHVLLGLAREREGVAAKVLAELGVDLEKARGQVEFIIGRGGPETFTGTLVTTPRVKRVLELANAEATRLNHNYVGTEHILLGLIRENDGIGAQVLRNLGLNSDAILDQITNILSIGQRPSEPSWAKDHVISCRVDDRDLDAVDALIEARLRGTRSEAASWLLRAGIEANQDLFDKVYSAVSEIRRLRKEVLIAAMNAQEEKSASRRKAAAETPPTPPAG